MDSIILILYFTKTYLQNIPRKILKIALTISSLLKYYVWCLKIRYDSPKDEFDVAYSFNVKLYADLPKNAKEKYLVNLIKNRNKIHKHDC